MTWSCGVAEAAQRLLAVRDELEAAGTPLGAAQTAKAWAVQHILQSCQKRREKLVIFCQYLTDLDEVEGVLSKVCSDNPPQVGPAALCRLCQVPAVQSEVPIGVIVQLSSAGAAGVGEG